MRKRRRWILVLLVVLALGLGYMAYSLFIHSGADYLTVSELKLHTKSLPDQQLRVEGKVLPGSINWDDKTKVISFVLTDDRESMDVVYEGIVPDSFKPGVEVIVAGRYRPDGVFQAFSFGSRRSVCNLCH